jgi:hypothetical protein
MVIKRYSADWYIQGFSDKLNRQFDHEILCYKKRAFPQSITHLSALRSAPPRTRTSRDDEQQTV